MPTVSIYTHPSLQKLLQLETLREARADGTPLIAPATIVAAAARAAVLSPRSLAGVVLAEVQSAGSVTHQRAESLVRPLLPAQADAGKVAYEVLEALSRGSDSFPQRLRPVYDTAQRTTRYLPTNR